MFAVGACKPPEKPPALVVSFHVIDEAKLPIDGAEIVSQSEVVARTNAEGKAQISLNGKDDGSMFPVEVKCPKLFRSPNQPIAVRRIRSGAAIPEYVAHCDRLRHQLIVAIKTDGATNMPVMHLGKEVARIDQAGHASVLVEGDVRERVELLIDTSDPKFAKMHPQNPTGSFEIGNKDEIKTFEVKFTRDKAVVRAAPKKSGPKAL